MLMNHAPIRTLRGQASTFSSMDHVGFVFHEAQIPSDGENVGEIRCLNHVMNS